MNERDAARQLSEYLDQLVSKPDSGGGDPAGRPATAVVLDSGMGQAIARLSALPALLPAPDAAFEQRVWQRVRAVDQAGGQSKRLALGLPVPAGMRLRFLAPFAVLAVALLLLLPGPRAALGNWMARIRLGRVDLVLAPDPTPRSALVASSQDFASLGEAEHAAGFHVLAPAYLPAGYDLTAVQSVSYEQLPVWMQPLYVESTYRPERTRPEQVYALLRQFNARQAGGVQVGEIEYQSQDIRSTRALTLNHGAPAVLLEFRQSDPPLRELIWEHDGMTLELWSATLSDDELVRIAESLR